MKKRLLGKAAIVIMSSAIFLTGCGDNGQEISARSEARTRSEKTSENNSDKNSKKRADNNEENNDDNVFKDLKIDTMTVSFYNGYNYSTAEAINKSESMTVEKYTISLDEEQIEKVQKTLSDIEVYHYEEYDGIMAAPDNYIININDSMEVYCSSFRYIAFNDPLAMFTADDFVQVINDICDEYLEANVELQPFEEGVDFIVSNGEKIEVDQELVDDLKKYSISKVDIKSTFEEYGTIQSTIALSNGAVLLLYEGDNKFGYIDGGDYNCFVMIGYYESYSLPEYLENVSNNATKNLGASDNVTITISYNDKEIDASEVMSSEMIEGIIEESKIMYYGQYDWLNEDYEIEDSVCIDVGSGCFYIPVEKCYGNRYYIDSEGNKYLVNSFGGEIESAIFEAFELEY